MQIAAIAAMTHTITGEHGFQIQSLVHHHHLASRDWESGEPRRKQQDALYLSGLRTPNLHPLHCDHNPEKKSENSLPRVNGLTDRHYVRCPDRQESASQHRMEQGTGELRRGEAMRLHAQRPSQNALLCAPHQWEKCIAGEQGNGDRCRVLRPQRQPVGDERILEG